MFAYYSELLVDVEYFGLERVTSEIGHAKLNNWESPRLTHELSLEFTTSG